MAWEGPSDLCSSSDNEADNQACPEPYIEQDLQVVECNIDDLEASAQKKNHSFGQQNGQSIIRPPVRQVYDYEEEIEGRASSTPLKTISGNFQKNFTVNDVNDDIDIEWAIKK